MDQQRWYRAICKEVASVVYVFRAKRADRLKMIWWDGTGLFMLTNGSNKCAQGLIRDGVLRPIRRNSRRFLG
jgi:transposase